MVYELFLASMVCASVMLIVTASQGLSELPGLQQRSEMYEEYIVAAGADYSPQWVLFGEAVGIVVGLSVGFIAMQNVVIAVVLTAALFSVPGALVRRKATARSDAFNDQVPDILRSLSNAVRAGLALPEAMRTTAKRAQSPANEYLDRVMREYEAGLTMIEALQRARARLKSPAFDLAISALVVNQDRGGNITETLESLAITLVDVQEVEERIQVTTAQGRKSARIMVAVPFFVMAMLYAVNPEVVGLLFNDFTGQLILLGASMLIALGYFWIQKIIAIDV